MCKEINCVKIGKIYKVELTKLGKLEYAGFWPISGGLPKNRFPVHFGNLNGKDTMKLNKSGQKKWNDKKLEIFGPPLPTGGGVHKIKFNFETY